MRRVAASAGLVLVASVLITAGVRADHFRIPDGLLAVGAQAPLSGQLGTFCTIDGCSDGDSGRAQDWVTVSNGPTINPRARLTFTLDDGSALGTWSAYYGLASQPDPPTHQLGSGADVSASSISFMGPPIGDWSLAINVDTVSDNAGPFQAIYFWRLHVTMPDTSTAPSANGTSSPPLQQSPLALIFVIVSCAVALFAAGRTWRLVSPN